MLLFDTSDNYTLNEETLGYEEQNDGQDQR
jgi:hypothetical protein